MRSDSNLRERFNAEGVDTRDYGSMPGVLDTTTRVEGRGRVLRSHSFSGHETNSLFINDKGRAYADWSALSGVDSISDGRGFAYLDYDRDGWVDIALVNSNAPQLELFRNRLGDLGAKGRAIQVRLLGAHAQSGPAAEARSARSGAGAHVLVGAGGMTLRREARIGDGFAAQNSATLTIGIGDAPAAEQVTVEWPSGHSTPVGRVPAGALVTVRETPGDRPADFEISTPHRAALATRTGRPLAVDRWESALPAPAARLRVLTTMATWCAVCRGELPHLADLRAAVPESEVALLGFPIDPGDGADELEAYQTERKPAYALLTGTTGDEKEAMKKLLIKHLGEAVLPATVMIDGEGNVVRVRKGVPTVSEVRRILKQMP